MLSMLRIGSVDRVEMFCAVRLDRDTHEDTLAETFLSGLP